MCKNTKNTLYEKILPFFRRKGFCEVPKKFPMLWKAWFSSVFSRDSRFSRKSLKRRKTLGKSGKLWKIQEKEQKSHLYKNFNFEAFLMVFRAKMLRFCTFQKFWFFPIFPDAYALKSLGRDTVPVQVRPRAPNRTKSNHIIQISDKWLRLCLSFTGNDLSPT